MSDSTTIQIAEYSRILSQIILDVQEQNYLNERASEKLSKTQFTILKIISLSDTHTVSKLAAVLNISRAAVSKNIEKLVRAKLVKRKIIQTDRRTTQISLTEKGAKILEDFDEVRVKKLIKALSPFSISEQLMLCKLLGDYVRSCIQHESDIESICLQCNGSISKECALTEHKNRCRFFLNSNKISTK